MTIFRELRAIYEQLPAVNCQRKCQECCGPIIVSPAERLRMEVVGGRPLVYDIDAGHCEYLVEGGCSVYAVRPLICRLWGAVEKMRCPFGCEPERWVSDAEFQQWVARIRALDGEFDLSLMRGGVSGDVHRITATEADTFMSVWKGIE
jgi:hypothetical protein